MTFMKSTQRYLSIMLTALFLLTTVTSVHAQASMIGTQDVISQEQVSVDREALKSMLSDEAVQEKMASMGVSSDQVEQRINSLTADELAYFNAQLDEAPAGAGILGVIVLFLVIFIITDLLCATNVYKFVNCINR
ncbi:PA2779 family protein [Halopseudomonas pelagia]|uniref:PA2779 family protein n=1 Tax=Halopseudomonas pelagia TaxID=553151 RepID=UPI0003AA0794|tara:strand:- start:2064 stop:2468 length:405 start_codon:yes stop_codon:yes gene_type:complete